MATIADIGVPGQPATNLTAWQAAVRDAVNAGPTLPYAVTTWPGGVACPQNVVTYMTLTLTEQAGGFTISAGTGLVVPMTGLYLVSVLNGFFAPPAGRTFIEIQDAGNPLARASLAGPEDLGSASTLRKLVVGTPIRAGLFTAAAGQTSTSAPSRGMTVACIRKL